MLRRRCYNEWSRKWQLNLNHSTIRCCTHTVIGMLLVYVLKMHAARWLPKSRSVHAFCPTRWTVRGETLGSFINNHKELMELWETSLETLKATEVRARVIGMQSCMKTFKFFFCCCLGEAVLCQTDNLSKALQPLSYLLSKGNHLLLSYCK